jgi:hypothetical protein
MKIAPRFRAPSKRIVTTNSIGNACDNCPVFSKRNQTNSEGDKIGDAFHKASTRRVWPIGVTTANRSATISAFHLSAVISSAMPAP